MHKVAIGNINTILKYYIQTKQGNIRFGAIESLFKYKVVASSKRFTSSIFKIPIYTSVES